jgi:hypothetical protein
MDDDRPDEKDKRDEDVDVANAGTLDKPREDDEDGAEQDDSVPDA